MEDVIPNNVFVSERIETQIKQIADFKKELKEKYSTEFENDKENTFIHLNFELFPEYENGKDKISFNVDYDEKTPEHIKEEFETYIKRYAIWFSETLSYLSLSRRPL